MDISTTNCHENKVYVLQFLNKGKKGLKLVHFFSTAQINLHKGVLLIECA